MTLKGQAVTYHRVSTTDQDPALARDELRRAVQLRDLVLVEEIEETGSGARNNRPGLVRVMQLAARGEVSHVLCWRLDRFGRSTLDLLSNIERLNDAGVTFVSTSQMLDVGPRAGAIGKMVMGILASLAEYERDTIRERTRLAMDKLRASGRRLGRPPAVDAVELAELVSQLRHWSVRGLAGRLGVNRTAVRRALSEMGVARESPPGGASAPLSDPD